MSGRPEVAFEKRGGNLRALQNARYRDKKVGLPELGHRASCGALRRRGLHGGRCFGHHGGLYAELAVKSSSRRLTQSLSGVLLRLAVLL